MATIRQRKSGSWEIIIQRKGVLEKPHYASAETKAEAEVYAAGVERLLDQGILPSELMISPTDQVSVNVADWAKEYQVNISISIADQDVLNQLYDDMQRWPTSKLNLAWAENWVKTLKDKRLSPSTIRHKTGAVRRMLDWACRKERLQVNPFSLMPKNYANYAPGDGVAVKDVERDRRLMPGEYERIMNILNGGAPADRQRSIQQHDRLAWRLLFIMATETAMRLREMYTLTIDQVDLKKRTIFLDETKNGDLRQVPLSSVIITELSAWSPAGKYIFPWWHGDTSISGLKRLTTQLSRKWSTIADLAGCDDLRFHDLRHEAVCRLYERTTLGDVQIARISGHKDLKTLKRYANLRGSDLVDRLW